MAVANDTLVNCTFEVIVGTYEEFVLGYIFQEESKVILCLFCLYSMYVSVLLILTLFFRSLPKVLLYTLIMEVLDVSPRVIISWLPVVAMK